MSAAASIRQRSCQSRLRPIWLARLSCLVVAIAALQFAQPCDAQAVGPTLIMAVKPSSIQAGGSATLTWSSSNASSCTASGAWSGRKAIGSATPVTVQPTAIGYYSYILTCTGSGGSVTGTAVLAVVPPLATQIAAAQATASNPDPASSCGAIRQNKTGSDNGFYWEIGDRNGISTDPATGATASGSVQPAGLTRLNYTRYTALPVASASKLLYGAYVVETQAQQVSGRWQLPAAYAPFLNFTSGYDNMAADTCATVKTVGECLSQLNGSSSAPVSNGTISPTHVGYFFYQSGHLEVFEGGGDPAVAGVMNGAGSTRSSLASAMINTFSAKGVATSLTFLSPVPAGAVKTTALDYAAVLQGLVRTSNPLLMKHFLQPTRSDPYAVCTDVTDAACGALSSPVADFAKWHYSITHWIEDDPTTGDGAYSSPGMTGFYPWVDASKSYYGILSRFDNSVTESTVGTPMNKSVRCGAAIRKAFMTGVAQY